MYVYPKPLQCFVAEVILLYAGRKSSLLDLYAEPADIQRACPFCSSAGDFRMAKSKRNFNVVYIAESEFVSTLEGIQG